MQGEVPLTLPTYATYQLTAHAHLGEGAVATLGLAYTELVAVWSAWLCALFQPVWVFQCWDYRIFALRSCWPHEPLGCPTGSPGLPGQSALHQYRYPVPAGTAR
jgi:hypothetical protein